MTTAILQAQPRTSGRTYVFVLMGVLFIAVLVMLILGLGQVPPPEASADAAPLLAAAPVQADGSDHLLVWVGNGAAPGQHSASQPGQLAVMDGMGVTEPLLELPQQTSRVQSCGESPLSPDGQMYAFYVGLDAGTLYALRGNSAPAAVDAVQGLTCLGAGTFQYSPDSNRMGYIAYESDAASSEFPDGFLKIRSTADLSEQFSYENVTAFDLSNTGAAFVSFFTNDKNEADEAAVLVWDGTASREVATLNPASDDCKFTSASVASLPDGKLLLVLGHRCKTGNTATTWQLYSVNPEERSATLAASDTQGGAFAAFARTNTIYLSPDGAQAYFTVPDGRTANTVGIKRVSVADLSLTDVVDQNVIAATYSGGANAFPQLSADGNWLAVVVGSPNNENVLQIWSLGDISVAPIVVSAGSPGDTISSMVFTPDSKQLIAVVGGDRTANNSLISVELSTGRDQRITRGHFGGGLTLSPDGSEVALLDWQIPSDTKEPPYANLVIVSAADSSVTTLFTGADVIDGKVQNQRFAFPLLWRSTAVPAVSG
ncbi:MAG: hypothetical protein J0L63_04165 [Anaerolineae bacterium]|nr:hypothetical protein [Anaerolineae bacterium]